MIKREVAENGVVADFFHDNSSERRKAIVLLGGSAGGKSWSKHEDKIELLLQSGYRVVSLAYFGMAGLPRSLEDVPLEYFENAFAWLAGQPEVIPGEYALIGFSKGGELALLLGSRYPQVQAVTALVPSSVVLQGCARGPALRARSSWSYEGKSLPFLPLRFSLAVVESWLTRNTSPIHLKAFTHTAKVQEAAIPVERTRGAILLVSGKRDEAWPSTFMCDQVMNRLAAERFEFYHEHVTYESGHNVLAVEHCWPTVLNFLAEHFPESGTGK